ncbi:MAG: CRTAC1 family protein [Verrucomicrobiota bacterium]|nr:CRTAC1 family protein [Verrucomicrobiota bacterium]
MSSPVILTALFFVYHTESLQAASPEHNFAIDRLEARRSFQMQQARAMQVFHDFRFDDQILASGIQFAHQVVDDAALTYKAAHYDHGNAVAVADVDGDLRLDIYWTTQIGENHLWRNLGKGLFEDITDRAGLALPNQISVGASFADIDNDGDQDLFVTTVRKGNHLFQNQGNGVFKDITADSGLSYSGHSSGAVFWDYDRDGVLDLFVTNVGIYTQEQKGRDGFFKAYPDAFSGHMMPERTEYSILYRGLGKGKYKDVSKATGLRDASWSGDCAFADINEDGFLDLYIVNMQGDDHFYENQGGVSFVDKTSTYFPKTSWGAMGVKFFDANGDGRLDLYVTDIHSDMTQGQTMQALRFEPRAEKAKSEAFCSTQWTEAYLQGANNNLFGNALYVSQPEGNFREVSQSYHAETYWPWGFSVGDLNADGSEDVFVTAGMGYPFRYGINSLLLNDHGKRFFDSEFLLGVEPRGDGRTEKVWFTLDCDDTDQTHRECQGHTGRKPVLGTLSTRSSAMVDIDNDGDLDIITNEFNDRPQLLISNLTEKKKITFLKIKLVGRTSNRNGLGAKVSVLTAGKRQMQINDGKSGYLAQSSIPMYFGLGTATKVDAVEVQWPSGIIQRTQAQVEPNQTLTLREPDDGRIP